MSEDRVDPRVATEEELDWLLGGFDEDAARRIDAAYLQDVLSSNATPAHWVFGANDDEDSVDELAA